MLKANENIKMSTSSQNNGKKSSNSSIVNTPSSTPITTIANGSSTQANTQSSPPLNNNAPKYGTLVPNRIFVGGISANTTESELMQLFSNYGTVKAAKIIQDRAGVSRGYGFITFESEDDAKRPLREAENIVLRERKLNIAPAIKKQPFSRAFDASSPPAVAAGNPTQFFFPPGAAMPYFQGGVAYYQPGSAAPGDPTVQQPVYQTPPMYPAQTGPPQTPAYPSMMFPAQAIYMPQQYPMPMPYEYNFYQSNGASPSTQYVAGGQNGPGGPQCNPMLPSNSPPRPNCYGQQMPYNPNDPMFYNLPMYGTTLEGPPIYSEAFELGATGPYAEESYNNVDHTITPQDVETSLMPSLSLTGVSSGSNTTINITSEPRIRHPHVNFSDPNVGIGGTGGSKPPTLHQSTEMNISRSSQSSNERNSNTPVVSLLSIDHQQEKDYSSMQSGRRRKPLMQNNQNVSIFPTNGYVNSFVSFSPQQAPPPPPFCPPLFSNGYAFPDYRKMNGSIEGRTNNINSNKSRRRIFDNRRSNDHSSRSSLRTDSNSSASCVDENKNDEKSLRTAVNTPPPAPYSPMTHHQFKFVTNSNVKNIYNKHNNNNNNYTKPTTTALTKFPNDLTKHKNGSINTPYSNNNNNVASFNSQLPESLNSSNSQVHLSTTTSQSFVPATVQAQARRNKRSLRRSGTGGGGINEIGAGDAPLPDEVAGDVCKKLESLKL